MNEANVVLESDFRRGGRVLTSIFPVSIAPFREGVYLVKTSDIEWMFAHYTLELSETFLKGRKQQIYVPGHWGQPAYTAREAYMSRSKRDFKAAYRWAGLAEKP